MAFKLAPTVSKLLGTQRTSDLHAVCRGVHTAAVFVNESKQHLDIQTYCKANYAQMPQCVCMEHFFFFFFFFWRISQMQQCFHIYRWLWCQTRLSAEEFSLCSVQDRHVHVGTDVTNASHWKSLKLNVPTFIVQVFYCTRRRRCKLNTHMRATCTLHCDHDHEVAAGDFNSLLLSMYGFHKRTQVHLCADDSFLTF